MPTVARVMSEDAANALAAGIAGSAASGGGSERLYHKPAEWLAGALGCAAHTGCVFPGQAATARACLANSWVKSVSAPAVAGHAAMSWRQENSAAAAASDGHLSRAVGTCDMTNEFGYVLPCGKPCGDAPVGSSAATPASAGQRNAARCASEAVGGVRGRWLPNCWACQTGSTDGCTVRAGFRAVASPGVGNLGSKRRGPIGSAAFRSSQAGPRTGAAVPTAILAASKGGLGGCDAVSSLRSRVQRRRRGRHSKAKT